MRAVMCRRAVVVILVRATRNAMPKSQENGQFIMTVAYRHLRWCSCLRVPVL